MLQQHNLVFAKSFLCARPVLSALHTLSHLTLTIIQRGTYPYYHFTDEETDTEVNAQYYGTGPETEPRQTVSGDDKVYYADKV